MINPHGPGRYRAVLVSGDLVPYFFTPHGPVSCIEGLPEGTVFAGMAPEPGSVAPMWLFLFTHDSWDLVAAGGEIPSVLPMFRAHYPDPPDVAAKARPVGRWAFIVQERDVRNARFLHDLLHAQKLARAEGEVTA